MNSIFLFSLFDININIYHSLFVVMNYFLIVATIWMIYKQAIYKAPILTFFSILIVILSIVYNFMLTSTDLDTAVSVLFIFYVLIPFLFPTLLFHLNYSLLSKRVTLASINYYLFPFMFFVGGLLFVDTSLFFESAVVSKSYDIALVEIKPAVLYYLVYVYMIFTTYLMLSTLLKARRNLNIDKGPFILYTVFIIIAPIAHISFFEFKFVKIDYLLFIYQLLALFLCWSHIFTSLTSKSDKVLVNYINNLSNPIFSLDSNRNVIFTNKAGRQFARNHFALQDTSIDNLSKCNWHDFITTFYGKNIELIDDFGFRTLRFNAVNVIDTDDKIKEQLLLFYDYTNMALLQDKVDVATKRDAITKTLTHSNIYEEIEKAFIECVDRDRDMSVILVKLNNISFINNKYTDLAGDYVLKKVSRILMRSTRSADLIGRFTGDVFLIILNDTSLSRAKDIADRIVQKVTFENFVFFKKDFKVDISAGVANYRVLNRKLKDFNEFIDVANEDLINNTNNSI